MKNKLLILTESFKLPLSSLKWIKLDSSLGCFSVSLLLCVDLIRSKTLFFLLIQDIRKRCYRGEIKWR